MNPHAEALLDRLRDVGLRRRLVLGAPALDEVQDLVGTLVRALGPAGSRQEPRDPAGTERRVGRVERLAAQAEDGRDFGHRPAVHAMAADHLVLHLHAIPPIEELLAGEGVVLHGLGVRVQGAGRPERGGLGVLLGWATPWHVNAILSTCLVRVKGIRGQATENVTTIAQI